MAEELLITTIDTEVITTDDQEVITLPVEVVEIVDAAAQGPMGPQGPQGLSGASVSLYPAAVPVSGHAAIVLNATGQALPADASDPTHFAVAGVTVGAATAGDNVEVQNSGVLEHSGWTFTAGLPVFLGLAGAITQVLPPGVVFSKVLGVAVSPTRISLDFQPAIFIQ